ncbi:MAG: GxxExxY protein [Bacteroidetes bacterium]|jgi:GxxExxY protein|nr:GxxExxY protein [Bacteroidota bacterium]
MINQNYLHSALTSDILKAYYKVYNTLGYGFLEKVYENAMMIELRKMGIQAVQQQRIKVYYEGEKVGEYFADILVENKVIVELKAKRTLHPDDEAQLYNYLNATTVEVGMLLNFGEEPEHKRRVLTNDNKAFLNQK